MNIVITGAGRGLGAGMARAFAAKGASVTLLDRDPEPLAQVVADCPGAKAFTVDVAHSEKLQSVADQVPNVDVLVVNAGIGGGGLFSDADPQAFEQIIEVNLLGSIRTTRAFLPHVIASRGHILQIASLAAIVPAPMMAAYCSSKSGVEAFAHCLRGEVQQHGVTVGVAYLGFTDTDMVREADRDPVLAGLRASLPWPLRSTTPLAPAVARLVAGIEGRKPHVYSPPWIRALPLVRGALPGMAARGSRKVLAK